MEETTNPKFQKLITTARNLFWKHGIRRVSIEEICQEANVSKMTFYKHFKNKIDVVRFIMDRIAKDALAQYHAIIGMDIPYEEKIRKLIQLKKDFTEGVSKEFLKDLMTVDDPEFVAWYRQMAQERIRLFLSHFQEAQKKGDIRSDVKPEFIMYILNAMMEMANDDHLLQLYESTKEMSEELMNFLFYGILARNQKSDG